jgi:hypothetical protein
VRPNDDAFARRRLIEGADDTDDGGHDLEFSPDLGEVVLDHVRWSQYLRSAVSR